MSEGQIAAAVGRLRQAITAIGPVALQRIAAERVEFEARFGPMLTPEHLPRLAEEEIRPFFYIEHNKHWTGLYRQVNRVCGDMAAFRAALLTLVNESRPIEHRIDEAAEAITGLGKGILTAFLVVAFPEKYGVLNNTSESALVELGLTPAFERGMSLGERYVRINEVFLRLAQELGVDLWTLDTLWWQIASEVDSEPTSVDLPASAAPLVQAKAAQFGLERHLARLPLR